MIKHYLKNWHVNVIESKYIKYFYTSSYPIAFPYFATKLYTSWRYFLCEILNKHVFTKLFIKQNKNFGRSNLHLDDLIEHSNGT